MNLRRDNILFRELHAVNTFDPRRRKVNKLPASLLNDPSLLSITDRRTLINPHIVNRRSPQI